MREALEGFEGSIKVGGRTVTNLRYADDVALLAGSANELQEILNRTQVASRERGLKLNVEKTKVMLISKNSNQEDFEITLEGETIEIVKEFKYLGTLINDNYDDTKEIRRRIAIAKHATVSLNKIWKDKSISKRTKIRLLRSLVFPIATYASECWAMKKNDRARIRSFEIWAYRRLLRVSWTEKRSNESILEEIGEYKGLVDQIGQQKLQFIGHIMRHRCIENDLLTGMVFGKRSRGRQKTRLTNTINERLGLTINEAVITAQDRDKWRNIVYAAIAVREAECSEQ